MSAQYLSKVAIVGAGGNCGRGITEALLKTGKHTVTAITRVDSQSTLPDGVVAKHVDYDKPDSLIEALKGQEVLVITMNPRAKDEAQRKLIDAAIKAGVTYILPNEWAPDTAHEGLRKDVWAFAPQESIRQSIAASGTTSFISISTGFWYEYSLAIPAAYGFDFAKREVTLFDNGETKICTSTWPQVGRAVAALLSLPMKTNDASSEQSLQYFRNKICYINSFTVSQNDMFDSALRVTGTTKDDWKIINEPSAERYTQALKAVQEGDFQAFVKVMYTRVFYDDGAGDFEKSRGTANAILGLPKEDLDKATEAAIERSKTPLW